MHVSDKHAYVEAAMVKRAKYQIFLVSDGTCRTCEQVVKAVLTQFANQDYRLVRKPNVRRTKTVARIVEQAKKAKAIVFYTLVADDARAAIRDAAEEHMVEVVDILGPVLAGLYDLFQSLPLQTPGMLYKTNKEQFDRIDAVDYTLHHDDGCGMQDLDQADVVLVGVSRASKSTTCFYLAYRGIRAANVPLFAGEEPPKELLELDPRKVIGLTANAYRMESVREARVASWGMDPGDHYADRRAIMHELRETNAIMARYGWRTVDVSHKAVEEVAREVRVLLNLGNNEGW